MHGGPDGFLSPRLCLVFLALLVCGVGFATAVPSMAAPARHRVTGRSATATQRSVVTQPGSSPHATIGFVDVSSYDELEVLIYGADGQLVQNQTFRIDLASPGISHSRLSGRLAQVQFVDQSTYDEIEIWIYGPDGQVAQSAAFTLDLPPGDVVGAAGPTLLADVEILHDELDAVTYGASGQALDSRMLRLVLPSSGTPFRGLPRLLATAAFFPLARELDLSRYGAAGRLLGSQALPLSAS